MIILAGLLALCVLLLLVFYTRSQSLQSQLSQYHQELQKHHASSRDAIRLLRLSAEELQIQMLDRLKATDERGVLTPHEFQCIHFLLSNLSEIVTVSAQRQISVYRSIQLLAHQQDFELMTLNLFIKKQQSDVINAWHLNQLPAFIGLCRRLSHYKENEPTPAKAC